MESQECSCGTTLTNKECWNTKTINLSLLHSEAQNIWTCIHLQSSHAFTSPSWRLFVLLVSICSTRATHKLKDTTNNQPDKEKRWTGKYSIIIDQTRMSRSYFRHYPLVSKYIADFKSAFNKVAWSAMPQLLKSDNIYCTIKYWVIYSNIVSVTFKNDLPNP